MSVLHGEEVINELVQACYRNSAFKGFWEEKGDPWNFGEKIALIHSELSEALEAIREGNPPCPKDASMSTLEEEMADVVIRVMDFCYARGINLEQAIAKKHAVNVARPYKHGGKKF